MGDPQRFQIRDNGSCGIEAEICSQLQSIGCNGNGGRHQDCPMCQNTDHGAN